METTSAAPPLHQLTRSARLRPGYNLPVMGVVFGLSLLAALLITRLGIAGFEHFVRDAGMPTDPTPTAAIVGDVALAIPHNKFRRPDRRSEANAPVDLHLHWPSLEGFSIERAAQFQSAAPDAPTIYVTLQPAGGAMAPEERFRRLYPRVLTDGMSRSEHGFVIREFRDGHGYDGERLFIAPDPSRPLVSRCDPADHTASPTCLVQFRTAEGLDVNYRIRQSLLADWRAIDEAVRRLVGEWIAAAEA